MPRRLPEQPVNPVIDRTSVIAEQAPGESSAGNRKLEVTSRGIAVTASDSGSSPPLLVPSRPPLRVEEGLIEVGWGGNLEAEAAVSAGETVAPLVAAAPAAGESESPGEETTLEQEGELPSEEMIEDHYAALQAWTEWAKNRGRASSPSATGAGKKAEHPTVATATMAQDEDQPDTVEGSPAPGLRAELQHEHAPYSQLFSRLRQSK